MAVNFCTRGNPPATLVGCTRGAQSWRLAFRAVNAVHTVRPPLHHLHILAGELCSQHLGFSLAGILVLAGTAGAGRMAPPNSTRISAWMKCALGHVTPVSMCRTRRRRVLRQALHEQPTGQTANQQVERSERLLIRFGHTLSIALP